MTKYRVALAHMYTWSSLIKILRMFNLDCRTRNRLFCREPQTCSFQQHTLRLEQIFYIFRSSFQSWTFLTTIFEFVVVSNRLFRKYRIVNATRGFPALLILNIILSFHFILWILLYNFFAWFHNHICRASRSGKSQEKTSRTEIPWVKNTLLIHWVGRVKCGVISLSLSKYK